MRVPAWVNAALVRCAPAVSLLLAVLSMPLLPALYYWHELAKR